MTSRGLSCIERCKVGPRAGIQEVYWCPAVDGISSIHSPGHSNSGRPDINEQEGNIEENKVMWDYCTPAPEKLEEEPETVKPVTLPSPIQFDGEEDQGGSSGSGGGSGGRPTSTSSSSLPGVPCQGNCRPHHGSESYTCDVNSDPSHFHCSPSTPLKRDQVGSHTKLWCLGECLKRPGQLYHMCKTMAGYDRCSPTADRNSEGGQCFERQCLPDYSSENSTGHYQCDSEQGEMESLVDCGFWQVDSSKKEALEYTHDDKVCASPCLDHDGEMFCEYVQWKWNEDDQEARLISGLGSCGDSDSSGLGTVGWAILIGGLVLGVVLIGVVAMTVARKKYTRASTSGP